MLILQTIGVYRESAVIASVEMLMRNVVCSYDASIVIGAHDVGRNKADVSSQNKGTQRDGANIRVENHLFIRSVI